MVRPSRGADITSTSSRVACRCADWQGIDHVKTVVLTLLSSAELDDSNTGLAPPFLDNERDEIASFALGL